jgi:hypothetical protein
MNGQWRLLTLECCFIAARPIHATEYAIDFALVLDFEQLRPLIELCEDLGSLESKRPSLESAADLEVLRRLFESVGFAQFSGCPKASASPGVKPLPSR